MVDARSQAAAEDLSRRAEGRLPRVMIQQDCIPQYRLPIFRLLNACPHMDVSLVSDPHLSVPFLKVVDAAAHGLRGRSVRTHFLMRRPAVTWQPGAVRAFLVRRPDVLIAQGAYNNLTVWVLCMLARLRRVPVLLWGHGLLEDERGLRWWLRRLLYRMAQGHLLYGDHARKLLIAKGFSAERLHVIYNSLDFDAQQAVTAAITAGDIEAFRLSLALQADDALVAFSGRLQWQKRLDLLLDAIGILAGRGRRVHAALIGDGEERAALQSQAKALGIAAQIHFLGACHDERRVGVVMSAADLAVVPAAAGLAVMHALTFGTPLLLHDRVERHGPEWEAVEQDSTGFFYRYGDVEDLARAMEEALFPVPRKPGMSERCRAVIAERYNPHRQLRVIAAAVDSLLPDRAARRA